MSVAARPITVDIRQVFPDASRPRPIELHPAPTVTANARLLERASHVALAISIGSFLMGWFFLPFLPDGRLFADLYLPAFLVFIVLRLVGRHRAGAGHVRATRINWEQWAADRGLAPVHGDVMSSVPLDPATAGDNREWNGLHQGPLGPARLPAIVGETGYTKGSGKSRRHNHCFFVYMELPAEVAAVFPHSNVRRFCSTPVEDMDVWFADELRFESIDLDETHEVEVAGGGDPVAWRELFGPQLIGALTERYDVQWAQSGRHVMFAIRSVWRERPIPLFRQPQAPVERMDSLCAGAAEVAQRMIDVARAHAR